jgi:hypothetical protein
MTEQPTSTAKRNCDGQPSLAPATGSAHWHDCEHEWKEIDAPDLSENYGSVVCVKCECPGEMTWATREVFWPAT